MSEQTKRYDYIDAAKGIGMFAIIWGHICTYGFSNDFVYAFHIPLFFFLSGLTYKRTKFPTFSSFALHRAKTLLLPYVIFSVLTWALWATYNLILHNPINLWWPLFQTLVAQGSGKFLIHNTALWFLPCLYAIEAIYYYIDKLPVLWNALVCIICALIGVWMINGAFSHILRLLPWSLESAFAALIFYCVGNIITKYYTFTQIEEDIVSRKWISIATILILTPILAISSYRNGHMSLGSDLLGNSPILSYFNAFIGIIIIFLSSIWLCNIKRNNLCWNWIINFILFFGKNSLNIMATHNPIKGIIFVGLAGILHKSVSFTENNYACCILVLIITCVICSFVAILINKQKQIDRQCIKKWKH